jgi:protein TonB
MKKILLTLIALLLLFAAKAQKADTLKGLAADTLIFTKVEKEPAFPGGMDKFYRFFGHTFRYPAKSKEANIQGKVIIHMVVEKDGSLTHFKVIKSVSEDLDQEALRVMSLCPKWVPGTQNGQVVRVYYDIPLNFALAQ